MLHSVVVDIGAILERSLGRWGAAGIGTFLVISYTLLLVSDASSEYWPISPCPSGTSVWDPTAKGMHVIHGLIHMSYMHVV